MATETDSGMCILCETNPAPGTGIDAICRECLKPTSPFADGNTGRTYAEWERDGYQTD